jgi:hypothetical protein
MAVLGSTVDPRLGAVSPAAIQALSQAGAATGQMYQNLGESVAGVLEDVEYNKKGRKKYEVLMGSADATAKALNLDPGSVKSLIESAGPDLNALESLEKSYLGPALLGRAETRNQIEQAKTINEHRYNLDEKKTSQAQEFMASENEKDRMLKLNILDKDFENTIKRDEYLNNLGNESYEYQQTVLNAAKLQLQEGLDKLSLDQQKAKFNLINDLEDNLLERKIKQDLAAYTEYRKKIGNSFDKAEREKIHREYASRFDALGTTLPDLSDTLMSMKDLNYRLDNNEALPALPQNLSNRITEKEYHTMLIAANGGLTFEDMGMEGTMVNQTDANLAQINRNIYEEIRKKIEGKEYSKPNDRYQKKYIGPSAAYMGRVAELGAPVALQVIVDDRMKPGFWADLIPWAGDPTTKRLTSILERMDSRYTGERVIPQTAAQN